MDFGSLITRAWNTTWRNKLLWVLGFLFALGAGGVSLNFNAPLPISPTGVPGGALPFDPEDWLRPGTAEQMQRLMAPLMGGLAVLACVGLIIGLVLFVVGLIARGGLIAGVDQIERNGNTTFGTAWRAGASKFWPMLGVMIVLALPVLVLGLAFVCMAAFGISVSGLAVAGGSASSGASRGGEAIGAAFLGLLCIGLVLSCALFIYTIVAQGIHVYAERAVVLHDRGVMDSIRAGWAMLRTNLGNTILIALLMLVISIVIGLVTGFIGGILSIPSTGLALAGQDNGAISTVGVLVSVMAGLAITVIGAAIAALFTAFSSATWTLAYRQFAKE